MHLEHSEHLKQKNIPPSFGQLEVSLASKEDLKNLERKLAPLIGEEPAQQYAFVLQSMSEEDFRNHCDKAVKEFGQRLATSFGDEESFFELAPDAKFNVARSYSPSLDKVGYQNMRHNDIALLEFANQKERPFTLAVDLAYGTVAAGEKDQDKMLVFYIPGAEKPALEALRNHYGGFWQKELEFDPSSGRFAYVSDKKHHSRLNH